MASANGSHFALWAQIKFKDAFLARGFRAALNVGGVHSAPSHSSVVRSASCGCRAHVCFARFPHMSPMLAIHAMVRFALLVQSSDWTKAAQEEGEDEVDGGTRELLKTVRPKSGTSDPHTRPSAGAAGQAVAEMLR